jgi:5-methylcytosine-specific restriction endonuclease McrA
MMDVEKRFRAIMQLSQFTGVDLSSEFIRNTEEHFPSAGIPRIHHLIEGIYKPGDSQYALCIWSRSALGKAREIYPDSFHQDKDGSWTINYAAKKGPLDSGVNRALFACMQDKVPVLVLVTSQPRSGTQRAKYRLLGPAIIEDFDPATRRFFMRGCSSLLDKQISQYDQNQAVITSLRNRVITQFKVQEDRNISQYEQKQRDRAFRQIVLEEYRRQCALCQSKFVYREKDRPDLIEAEAAHIISVENNGTDDPRNGLSLCRRHHWAFDHGFFTITDARVVKISPAILRAQVVNFDLEEYESQPISAPARSSYEPHDEALHFHQEQVFRKR